MKDYKKLFEELAECFYCDSFNEIYWPYMEEVSLRQIIDNKELIDEMIKLLNSKEIK